MLGQKRPRCEDESVNFPLRQVNGWSEEPAVLTATAAGRCYSAGLRHLD
jgi:hypothetical protein